MEINLVNAGITIAGVLLANWGMKLKRAYPLIKEAYDVVTGEVEVRKDGKITDKEKAERYDDLHDLVQEAYAFIKGVTFNKSK